MNPELLRKALLNESPQFSSPHYVQGNAINQAYGTQAVNQPPVSPGLQPYIQSNASSILGLALQDAVFGKPQKGQSYLDMLKGNIGFNTPGGYGMNVGFNQPNPLLAGDVLDWDVNVKFPFNI